MSYTEFQSYFHHQGFQYDLNPIFKVAEKLPIQQLPLTAVNWVLEHDTPDPKRMEQADISIPLIVLQEAERYVLVDGLNRLAMLNNAGVKQVQCVVMPARWFHEGTWLADTATSWFHKGCANSRYLFKEWVIRMLAVTELPEQYPNDPIQDPQYLQQNEGAGYLNNRWYWPVKKDGLVGYVEPTVGLFVECVDIQPNQAIVSVNDRIALVAGSVPNLTEDKVTLVGNLLFNYVVLVYSFGNKIPFQTGKVKIRALEKLIIQKLVDDVDNPQEELPDKIYVRELKRYLKAAAFK